MKKINIILLSLLLPSFILAVGASANLTGSANTEMVLEKIDGLKKISVKEETKNNVVCTMEFAPVCGKLENGKEKTFSNTCQAKAAGAVVEYKGECGQKEEKKEKEIHVYHNTGITGGIKNINNKVPAVKVKVEAKGEPVPGAEIFVEQSNDEPKTDNGNKDQDKYVAEVKHFSINFGDNGIKADGKISAELKKGVFVKPGLTIVANNDGDDDMKLSLDGDKFRAEIKTEGQAKIEVQNGKLKIGDSEISLSVDEAVKKAKTSIDGEVVSDTELGVENGKAVYKVEVKKKAQLFGFIDIDTENEVKIDAETGAVVEIDKPWYSFLLF